MVVNPKKELIYQFMNTLSKSMDYQKKARHFGTDVLLHPAEIHLIDAIGRNPEISVTQLSKQNKVTKGAVSQMLTKLKSKKLIDTKPDPNNLSRKQVFLTEKGHTAFHGHRSFHQHVESTFNSVLMEYSDKELRDMKDFLKNLEGAIEEL